MLDLSVSSVARLPDAGEALNEERDRGDGEPAPCAEEDGSRARGDEFAHVGGDADGDEYRGLFPDAEQAVQERRCQEGCRNGEDHDQEGSAPDRKDLAEESCRDGDRKGVEQAGKRLPRPDCKCACSRRPVDRLLCPRTRHRKHRGN